MLFFPIGPEIKLTRVPVVTVILLCALLACFIMQQQLPGGIERWGLMPIRGPYDGKFEIWQLWTTAFLHADLFHLLGNMVFIWAFGRATEARAGSLCFILICLLATAGASCAHLLLTDSPAIGASGLAMGLAGASLALMPMVPFKLFYWVFLFLGTFSLQTRWLVLIYAALDLFHLLQNSEVARVAYGAHLGGFLIGLLLTLLLLMVKLIKRDGFDLWYVFRHKRRRASIMATQRSQQKEIEQWHEKKVYTPAQIADAGLWQAWRKQDYDGWATLLAQHPRPKEWLVSMKGELSVAAGLMLKEGYAQQAAWAYECLEQDETDATQKSHYQLMLAVIYQRHLRRDKEAKAILENCELSKTDALYTLQEQLKSEIRI